MSPSHVLEPTYERLRRELLNGRWSQDSRLEAHKIAEDYGVSMTPVRDCLNRLTGEGLVIMRYGEGYRVPRLTEKTLRDMIGLHRLLVLSSLSATSMANVRIQDDHLPLNYADAMLAIFITAARSSNNSAMIYSVRALGERMQLVRMREPTVFPDTELELRGLREALSLGYEELAAAIANYHDRRLRSAEALIAALN